MAMSQLRWRAASDSLNGGVVVAREDDGHVVVRDLHELSPVLRFTNAEFEAFLDGAKNGEFDDL